jgi:hypothetical protein
MIKLNSDESQASAGGALLTNASAANSWDKNKCSHGGRELACGMRVGGRAISYSRSTTATPFHPTGIRAVGKRKVHFLTPFEVLSGAIHVTSLGKMSPILIEDDKGKHIISLLKNDPVPSFGVDIETAHVYLL